MAHLHLQAVFENIDLKHKIIRELEAVRQLRHCFGPIYRAVSKLYPQRTVRCLLLGHRVLIGACPRTVCPIRVA